MPTTTRPSRSPSTGTGITSSWSSGSPSCPFVINDYWANAILLPFLIYAIAAIG
jgi:hypothetical protein